ncbi:MAG TPA: rod shape-determining protein MreC [Nocardioides sp.]|nr:rod shape-determining protein MreC [Nocardioides sp.]
MTLETLPPRRTASGPIKRVGLARERREDRGLPSRSLILALVLACATLMVIDKASGDNSPVDPVRHVAGEIVGPVEDAVTTVLHPVASIPGALRTNGRLRKELAAEQAQNAALQNEIATGPYAANRLAELDALRAIAGDLGYALKPARVTGLQASGPFEDTATIDAGSSDGLRPDMTVVNGNGLVGRVTSVTSHSATVLLITDPGSTVGGRVGDNMKLGFVTGNGSLGSNASLDLNLLDQTVVPHVGQTVVTWGSQGGAPYVAGVTIGRIVKVYQSLRETSYRAVIDPTVDFTSLDMVGVVVPSGTPGRVIEADGSTPGIGR